MTCEELKADYTSFALGIADDPERTEIRAHLERNCPVCTPGVTSAIATVTAMSGAVQLVDPPKQLRRRVSALVEPAMVKGTAAPSRPTGASILPWVITAIVSVVLILVARPSRRPASDLAKYEAAVTIFNDPATRDVTFGESDKPLRGRIFVNPARGIVLIATGMPKLSAGRTFELWLVPASGKPVAAGTFVAREDSTVVYVHPIPSTGSSSVTVTVEPEGGSEQPTTTPSIVAKL